jgi:hypothetical protein
MFANVKSLGGNQAAQVFTNGYGYDRVYPLPKKKDVANALMFMIQDSGIPQTVVTDNATEETAGDWKATCQKYHIKQEQTVPYSPWRNAAESSIRELKVGIRWATR